MKGLNRTSVLSPILVLAFCLGLPEEAVCQKDDLDSQKKLRQEIQLLNLLKGLYLSDEQMKYLIEKAREVEDIRESFIQKQCRYSDVSTQTLKRLKGELEEEKTEVSEEIARAIHQTRRKMLKLKADYEEKIEKIVEEVKNNLTGKQLHIIEEFKPCLVPPKGPARFGQADDTPGGVRQLERIRKMPDYRYSLKKYEFADRVLERALLHKPGGEELDQDQLRSKILLIFDEARRLSEIDFELQKEELVKKLRQDILPQPKTVDVDTKIERFLLSPVAVTLLEEKLRREREFPQFPLDK